MTNEEKEIETLLKEKIGLKQDSISSRRIAKAIEIRRIACKLTDLKSYLQLLHSGVQEWWELIDQIVVPETWFFRHPESFTFLHNYVKTQWLKDRQLTTSRSTPASILKVLSLPCSTGEEPYSIAMTLLDAGLLQEQFQIDALDISHKALQKAKKAIYGEYSFRKDIFNERSRYFQRVAQGYQLSESVRETVQLKQGNLLDNPLPIHKQYHIIFCRHLLIYLDLSARSRAIDVLEGLLTPPGFLFLGAPEISLLKPPQFQVIDYPYAFVYQKGSHTKPKNLKSQHSIPGEPISNPNKTDILQLPQRKKIQKSTPSQKNTRISPLSVPYRPAFYTYKQQPKCKNLLLEARHLANSGALDEAVSLCIKYLNQVSNDPQAYLLLGQVYQAKGDEGEAEQYFQKVIYLDPNCEEALIHLALLKESRGDFNGATLIRQRIQRLFKSRDD